MTDRLAARLEKDPLYVEVMGLNDPALVNRFARGVENFDRRVFSLTDDQVDLAFLPEANVGRWPIRVLLGHLADADVPYVHRMRRTVGEDNPVLAVWDERWGTLGRWLNGFSILLLSVGLWWLVIFYTGKNIPPDLGPFTFFMVPVFMVAGRYWVRWWAIRSSRLPLHEITERLG